MGLSKVLDNPDLMIGEKDTKELATAIADVNKHYDVPVLSEKSQAWAKLAMVAGGIYGPMIVMSMGSRKSKQAQKSAPQSVQAAPLPSTTVDTFTNPTFVSVPQE
ncbi:MAG TPA: hypothetical protein VFM46_12465 [Pseudomonadales bacterium]|nr:hypothetical protein [Pseudomonadales bacterium]